MNILTREKPPVVIPDILLLGITTLEKCRFMRSDPTLAKMPERMVTAWSSLKETRACREAGVLAHDSEPIDRLEMNRAAEKVPGG